MEKNGNFLRSAYFFFWTTMFLSSEAHAYIDPTTTAMLTQIVAGIFISLGLALGIFRRKIVIFFKQIYVILFNKKVARENNKALTNKIKADD